MRNSITQMIGDTYLKHKTKKKLVLFMAFKNDFVKKENFETFSINIYYIKVSKRPFKSTHFVLRKVKSKQLNHLLIFFRISEFFSDSLKIFLQ